MPADSFSSRLLDSRIRPPAAGTVIHEGTEKIMRRYLPAAGIAIAVMAGPAPALAQQAAPPTASVQTVTSPSTLAAKQPQQQQDDGGNAGMWGLLGLLGLLGLAGLTRRPRQRQPGQYERHGTPH